MDSISVMPSFRVEFCHWLLGNQQLRMKILFTDEAKFNRDGVTKRRNPHAWSLDNPRASTETFSELFLS